MKSQAGPILLVEDDPNAILLLDRAFRRVGFRHEIVVVRDGEEAVEYLSGRGQFQDRKDLPRPCLVLLDLKLPKRSGLEVLEWLRSRPELREMPVVVMTSSSHPSDREKALGLGVIAYVVKPIDLAELVTIASKLREYAEMHNSRNGRAIRAGSTVLRPRYAIEGTALRLSKRSRFFSEISKQGHFFSEWVTVQSAVQGRSGAHPVDFGINLTGYWASHYLTARDRGI
jgi:CheY-like chemotaxis protein